MSALTVVALTCDAHCGEYMETPDPTRQGAREWAAQQYDWVHTAGGLDLCPGCAEKWGDDEL